MRCAGVVLLAVATTLAPARARAVDPREILRSMGEAAAKLRDYTMTLHKQELRGDSLEPEQVLLEKWARPYRIYLKSVGDVQRGQEVLFVRGWNRDRIRAHKGSFPDVTLSLDPYGSWAMAHTHHPVTAVSLGSFVGILLENLEEADRRQEGSVREVGEETLWGRPCYRLELESPAAATLHVLVKGETLWDVARECRQDMYVILHYNRDRGWRRAADPRPGDTVLVPRYYAGRVSLWVDEELRLPIRALIYDHAGSLYERYEHRDLRIDVGLTDRDFDPANPDYHF